MGSNTQEAKLTDETLPWITFLLSSSFVVHIADRILYMIPTLYRLYF